MRFEGRFISGVSAVVTALLVAALGLLVAAPAFADAPAIVVDEQRLPTDVPTLVAGDHVLVPLREVFERFGADVSFDDANQLAIATLRGTTVKVSLRTSDAWVNEKHRTLDVGAREIAGRVLVPLRFVAEVLGVAVDYDASSNTVVIVSGFKSGSFAAATVRDGNGSGSFQTISAPKQAPAVADESPHQGELIGSQYPQIYARFNGGTSAVNPASVSVTVDGQDVTGASTVSSAYVSYTPQYSLQTGQHTVEINGAADDGTRFSDAWTFRVDAGSSSIYMPSGGGFGDVGGFSSFWFPRFRFFPPGFSVFTPGPLFFVSGGVIEVIFVSRFFPFGNGFFSINGIPGTFPLTPWAGNPGFFWGFTTVPFGAQSQRAIIAAHFMLPNGRSVVVHATAPLHIEGNRTRLPASLRYAVLPQIVGRPVSPHHLVVFRRLEPENSSISIRGTGAELRIFRGNGQTISIRSLPVITAPRMRPLPNRSRMPIAPLLRPHVPLRPVLVIHPATRLPTPVVIRPPAVIRAPIVISPPNPAPVPVRPIIQPARQPAQPLPGGKPKPR